MLERLVTIMLAVFVIWMTYNGIRITFNPEATCEWAEGNIMKSIDESVMEFHETYGDHYE